MFGWLFGKKTPAGDVCVVCESADLEALAPDAYRCRACGHEGGDGYAAWQDVQTRARYDDWTVAQLREHAEAQLNEVRSTLVGAPALHEPTGLATGTIGTVQVSFGGDFAQEDEAARLRWIQSERQRLVEEAGYGLRRVLLTLDALVDKGVSDAQGPLADLRDRPADVDELVAAIERSLGLLRP